MRCAPLADVVPFCPTTTDLSQNRFVVVPEEVEDMIDLERLNCFHNTITLFPNLISMQALTQLDLRCAAAVAFAAAAAAMLLNHM